MPLFLPLILALICMVAVAFSVYYFRRTSALYALLVEGANRYEELRKRAFEMEQYLRSQASASQESQDAAIRLERAASDAQGKAASYLQRLETKENELRLVTEKLELQKTHLLKQLDLSTGKITVLQDHVIKLEAKLTAVPKELTEQSQRSLQDLRRQLADTQSRLEVSERKAQDLERQVKTADPVEFKQMKRRMLQYDRLYTSMKGLREMADERSRNWEIALRKLAAHTLTTQPLHRKRAIPSEIGPLVGQALESIGAHLIDDDTEVSSSEINAALNDNS